MQNKIVFYAQAVIIGYFLSGVFLISLFGLAFFLMVGHIPITEMLFQTSSGILIITYASLILTLVIIGFTIIAKWRQNLLYKLFLPGKNNVLLSVSTMAIWYTVSFIVSHGKMTITNPLSGTDIPLFQSLPFAILSLFSTFIIFYPFSSALCFLLTLFPHPSEKKSSFLTAVIIMIIFNPYILIKGYDTYRFYQHQQIILKNQAIVCPGCEKQTIPTTTPVISSAPTIIP